MTITEYGGVAVDGVPVTALTRPTAARRSELADVTSAIVDELRSAYLDVLPTSVIAQYAGVTPEAFRNPGRGKELALSQYQSGVNIIFHASGSTGLGVFEAARASRKLAIGVDADQWAEAPNYVLTSMVKGVDAAVYDVIHRAKDGSFTGGIYQFGLAEGGVGYVYDVNNRKLIPDSVRARLNELQAEIIAGKIDVPSTR